MNDKQYYVYIMGNERPTLYVGITHDLSKRVFEHKDKLADGFTAKYGVNKLLYFETFDNPEYAIQREKNIKKWNRQWKLDLISKDNPKFKDLYHDIS